MKSSVVTIFKGNVKLIGARIDDMKPCEGVFCCYATCRNEIGWNVG